MDESPQHLRGRVRGFARDGDEEAEDPLAVMHL